MAITASEVKTLREKTGAGMMDCKKALTESDGDMAKAEQWLREKGMAAAAKRAGRVAAEGRVAARISEDGRTGAIVEVNCETDFVARNEDFGRFVDDLLTHVVATDLADQAAFEASTMASTGKSVADSVTELTGRIGEKIVARRFARLAAGEGCALGVYVHPLNQGTAVLVELKNADGADPAKLQAILKDVAMQAASMNAEFATEADVSDAWKAREREIALAQARELGKPENVLEKIAEGKVRAGLKEAVLEAQEFVKEKKKSVAQYVKEAGAAAGAPNLAVSRFVRFNLGSGVETGHNNGEE